MAVRARHRSAAAVRNAPVSLAVLAAFLAAGCAGGPPPQEWRLNSVGAIQAFERQYFAGNTAIAETEFRRARGEVGSTGRLDLLARLELRRCAVRAASLEFDDCPAFEALRADAAPAELAYADYLSGRAPRREAPKDDDPLARLVDAGVQFRHAKLAPQGIASAAETASAQGWRRPLLAWLGVQLKRAEAAGDQPAAGQLRRRIEAVQPAR